VQRKKPWTLETDIPHHHRFRLIGEESNLYGMFDVTEIKIRYSRISRRSQTFCYFWKWEGRKERQWKKKRKERRLYDPEQQIREEKVPGERQRERLALPIISLQSYAVSTDLYKAHCSHLQYERGS